MSIDELLGRLKGVRESGDGSWVACCPAHDDSNPSMSVTARNGKILLHCHAGCQASEIVAAMGLEMKDLFEDDSRGGGRVPRPKGARSSGKPPDVPSTASADATSKKKSGGHGRLVCDYIYRDEGGRALFKVERRVMPNGKKTFIAYHADSSAKGGWAFGIHDRSGGGDKLLVPFVAPYHLPALVTAAQAGRSLVIVEGEKDVETVERIGLVATCNPFGAGKWGNDWPADWAKWFVGLKSILIVADKDPETREVKVRGKVVQKQFLAGQKHAWDVYRKIQAAGVKAPVRLMCMPDVGGTKVKDFTDWVEARHAAKLSADKTALAAAMLEFGEWPAAWHFTDEEMAEVSAIARAEKSARDTSSEGPAEVGEDVARAEKSARDAASSEKGRFGRLRPRAPGEDSLKYMVDFDIGGGKRVSIEFEYGWMPEQMFAHAIAVVSRACPNNEVPKGVPVRIKAWCAAIWLLMRGSFFWHNDYRDFATCMFLDRDKSNCKLMRVMSDEFFAFVGAAARLEDVDPKKGDMAKIFGLVKQIAVSNEYSRGVTPSNSWDRRGRVIYISSGDTEMCRIDAHGAAIVQNGTDGVVFLRGKTLAPWKLEDGEGVDPFATASIFKGASFADNNGLMNVRLWVMNLFASHATKPPLLITGGAGSGKTRMAKGIKEILGMRQDGALDLSVQQIEDGDKGLDAFWATVNDGKLEVFDNFDTKVKWASDTLQTAATDGQTKRRTLYTTFGVSILRANASIILTSNNPIFSTEGNGGLADRLITIPLSLNRSTSRDAELSREIAENRDKYLTWIVRTLTKVLADEQPVDASVNRRHPDYGVFSVRVGRAIGDEQGAVAALGAAEADKALLPLRNDVITREILAVLQDSGWKWSGTSGELSDKIIARQGDDGDEKTKQIYSSRRVGKALNKYLRQFSIIFKAEEPRILTGKMHYAFHGLTPLGESVVGLVGLDGQIGETIGRGSAHGFMGNGDLNPPNLPVTPPNLPVTTDNVRARANDKPFLEEREREREDNEMDGDEWGFDL